MVLKRKKSYFLCLLCFVASKYTDIGKMLYMRQPFCIQFEWLKHSAIKNNIYLYSDHRHFLCVFCSVRHSLKRGLLSWQPMFSLQPIQFFYLSHLVVLYSFWHSCWSMHIHTALPWAPLWSAALLLLPRSRALLSHPHKINMPLWISLTSIPSSSSSFPWLTAEYEQKRFPLFTWLNNK